MKAGIKNLVMLLAVVCLTILSLPVEKTFAANAETVIDTKYGVIINDKTISRVDVVGTYREDNRHQGACRRNTGYGRAD